MNSVTAQDSLIHTGGSHWKAVMDAGGVLHSLQLLTGEKWVEVDFRKGPYAGFRWYVEQDGSKQFVDMELDQQDADGAFFTGKTGSLSVKLRYHSVNGKLAVTASAANTGKIPLQPQALGLITGIDTYMEKFPDWNHKFFPTLLRCEPTHFWGYGMRPDGSIISVACPHPIASWSLKYNVGYLEGEMEWGGHRVETFMLDLLHAAPLPERHPQTLFQLLPGEEKQWTIHIGAIERLDELLPSLAPICEAPMIEMDRTTIAAGETAKMRIYSTEPVTAMVEMPDGLHTLLEPQAARDNQYELELKGGTTCGHIKVCVQNRFGRRSEGIISVRPNWLWFMEKAREAALLYPPRATSHCESWYGLYTLYLAEQYRQDADMLEQTEHIFENIYPYMFDTASHEPSLVKHRIQNVSSMVGVLVDRYEATGDEVALERASALADWLIDHAQGPDGSYRAGKTHYTSVIYPAKNIMELILAEKPLAEQDLKWKTRLEKHTASVRLAMDELVTADGDIDTEGELTYEDGMISCSALQLGLFALMQQDKHLRVRYQEAALKLLSGHDCLTNLLIPDGRQRGATRRFWESQYDVAIQPNMLNSPHGWTSWRIYATWYAYLLTHEVAFLQQTMNAVGSTVQAVDMKTGQLRWAFVPDPYIRARQISEPMLVEQMNQAQQGHHHTLKYPSTEFVIGEQYVGMISDWHTKNLQDNDVHEHFKCLAEVALGKAYVAKDHSGSLITWNCKAEEADGMIQVKLTEPQVKLVHLNVGAVLANIDFDNPETVQVLVQDPCWVTSQGQVIDNLFI